MNLPMGQMNACNKNHTFFYLYPYEALWFVGKIMYLYMTWYFQTFKKVIIGYRLFKKQKEFDPEQMKDTKTDVHNNEH